MFSDPYPASDEVLDELGDKFLGALVAAVRGTRVDINELREFKPGWFPSMHARCLSNIIHDRIWARLVAAIESDPDTKIIERGATREIAIGLHVRLRVKRHHVGDKISTYPTRTAIEFWKQSTQYAFPGLEEVRIAVGYRWDPEMREIEAPLLSLRDGKDNVIWAVELDEPAEGVKVTYKPIEPTMPSIEFGDLDDDADETGAAGDR
jgi:hypothetical protein